MKTPKEDPVLFELRRITKLLAMQITSNLDLSQKDKIALFHSNGFKPPEIAEMLNIGLSAVHVNLKRLGKKGGKKSIKTVDSNIEEENNVA